jgi:hypothetical protein
MVSVFTSVEMRRSAGVSAGAGFGAVLCQARDASERADNESRAMGKRFHRALERMNDFMKKFLLNYSGPGEVVGE